MPALTPTFLMDLESRMQIIAENEYNRLNSNLWWPKLTKVRSTTGRRDVITWLLSTAMIKDQGKGGNIAFDDLVSTFTEIENKFSGTGLELSRAQLEDTDGGGMDLAAQWSADIGAYMSYWPQKQVTAFLKTAHLSTVVGYDKQIFFSNAHPVNPFNTSAGTYANLLTGSPVAASGNTPAYPGTLPLDESVTADVALQNMAKLFSYIASIRMPNGEDPRYLRPAFILCSPRLFPRLVQISNAKFIAQAATGGAAVGDVEALIRSLGFAQPVMADELAGFESDTTYFVVCEQVSSVQLGAVIYTEREPYKINYYSNIDQVELSRKQKLEWHCIGRNVVSPGHPYLVIKGKGS